MDDCNALQRKLQHNFSVMIQSKKIEENGNALTYSKNIEARFYCVWTTVFKKKKKNHMAIKNRKNS